jgi:HTH-type transcriptional regulator/antitoxin HigA
MMLLAPGKWPSEEQVLASGRAGTGGASSRKEESLGRNAKDGKKGPVRPPSATYLDLVRQHPLRPVESEADRDAALAFLDALLARGGLSADQEDYLEVLALLVRDYEDRHHPAPPVSGAEMLRHKMDHREETLAQVARGAGVPRPTLAAVLGGKREVTPSLARKLAACYRTEPSLFLE